jgi:hypothetical protein
LNSREVPLPSPGRAAKNKARLSLGASPHNANLPTMLE